MDSTQFVTQLAQLSQVEQAVATNTNLENLGTKIGSLVSVAGADMIGRNVTFESSQFGLESGATDATYTIPEGTSSLTVDILDENGTVIRQLTELSTDHTQIHTLDWDGKDAAGNSLLDGEYFMRINALDAQLQAISGSSTYRKATVEQVLFSNGENYFTLDSGQQIQADKVLAAS